MTTFKQFLLENDPAELFRLQTEMQLLVDQLVKGSKCIAKFEIKPPSPINKDWDTARVDIFFKTPKFDEEFYTDIIVPYVEQHFPFLQFSWKTKLRSRHYIWFFSTKAAHYKKQLEVFGRDAENRVQLISVSARS